MAGSVRDPSNTVMNVLENPLLPGSDWVYIPYEGKAGPETISSQTTARTVDTAAFNNTTGNAPNGLFKTNVEAFDALGSDLVSNAHKTSGFTTSYVNEDETSNSNKAPSSHKPDNKYPDSPGSGPDAAFDVSHMASWAEKDISKMNQE